MIIILRFLRNIAYRCLPENHLIEQNEIDELCALVRQKQELPEHADKPSEDNRSPPTKIGGWSGWWWLVTVWIRPVSLCSSVEGHLLERSLELKKKNSMNYSAILTILAAALTIFWKAKSVVNVNDSISFNFMFLLSALFVSLFVFFRQDM